MPDCTEMKDLQVSLENDHHPLKYLLDENLKEANHRTKKRNNQHSMHLHITQVVISHIHQMYVHD